MSPVVPVCTPTFFPFKSAMLVMAPVELPEAAVEAAAEAAPDAAVEAAPDAAVEAAPDAAVEAAVEEDDAPPQAAMDKAMTDTSKAQITFFIL